MENTLLVPDISDYFEEVMNRGPIPAYIDQIQPRQPGEYGVISGKTGIGKTNFALHLAFCCSTGVPFHTYHCDKAVTAFLSAEGDDQNMLSRYLKIRKYFPDTDKHLRYNKLEKARPEIMLETMKSMISGCSIVILDGSRFLMSDYCDPKQSSEFVVEFMNMLKERGAVAILTLQIKKPDSRYLVEPGDVFSIKGATDIVDGATTVMLLEHTPHKKSKEYITLYFAKTRISTIEMPEVNLKFDKANCRFMVVPE